METIAPYIMVTMPFVFFLVLQIRTRKLRYNTQLQNLKNRIGIHDPQLENHESAIITLIVDKFSKYMEQTGLPAKTTGQLVIAQALIIFAVFGLLFLNIKLSSNLQLLVTIAPFTIPAFLYYTISKRKQEFIRQFPDAIESMVRSLEAGNSIDQAMKMIATDFSDPISGEFKIMSQQIMLGVPYIEVLTSFRHRVPIQEVHYLVMALIIQRETGGRLVQILDQLSTLMRRRSFFQGKLKSLTAESKFTAFFIGGLPLTYIAYRYFFKRQSLDFFLNDPTGFFTFKLALGLIFVGIVLLKFMMRIRF